MTEHPPALTTEAKPTDARGPIAKAKARAAARAAAAARDARTPTMKPGPPARPAPR